MENMYGNSTDLQQKSQRCLVDECFHLNAKLKDKDEAIERVRAESRMNAQAIKKFVEQNQKLSEELQLLKYQSKAREAESTVQKLFEENRKLSEELQFFKHRSQARGVICPEVVGSKRLLISSTMWQNEPEKMLNLPAISSVRNVRIKRT